MLEDNCTRGRFLCVGIDPKSSDIETYFPSESISEGLFFFGRAVIDQTKHIAGAYKLNLGYFLGKGSAGMRGLSLLTDYAAREASDVPIILDGKFGDIGRSNEAYAGVFDTFNVDAVTISPYLGVNSLKEFVRRPEKAAFFLCRTSNPESEEIQNCRIRHAKSTLPLYLRVAQIISDLRRTYSNCGLVVGSTAIDELELICNECPEIPLLIPGIGTQGGSLQQSVSLALQSQGREGILMNVSSDLLRDGINNVGTVAENYHIAISHSRDLARQDRRDLGPGVVVR